MKDQLVTHNDKIYDGTNRCTSVTVHETGNPDPRATAQKHADLQSGGGARNASWHVQVDGAEAIRSYPDTAQCWHAGADEGNRNSLAVEICVNEGGDYDEAFRRAAGVVRDWRIKHKLSRADVKQHWAWTGKLCPANMILANRWPEFLDLTEPNQKAVKPVAQMVSPFEGRLTQNHGDSGGYRGHKGMDIAPPKPGQTGMPIYAAFGGTVERVFRTAKPGNKNSTWAPGRTGDGMLIRNPDGEGNGYNHMYPLAGLKKGSKVKAGDLIGHNNLTGNLTGAHLHFELWAEWLNHNSDYDPQLAFKKFGVTPGSKPSLTGNVTPVQSKPKPVSNSKEPSAAVKKKLKNMGYPKQGMAEVKAYQDWHGLVPDGDWGDRTETKYQEVVRAQNATKKMKNVPDNWKSDGYWGATSKKWAGYASVRNGWGNPKGHLVPSYINNLKKAKAW